MSKRSSSDRNARKRFFRQQLEYWTADGEPKDKAAIERLLVTTKAIAAKKRELLVAFYETELRTRSKRLDYSGCWAFMVDNIKEAKRWGCDDRLKSLTAHYATEFAAAGHCVIH